MQGSNPKNYEHVPPLDSRDHSNHASTNIALVEGYIALEFDGIVETI